MNVNGKYEDGWTHTDICSINISFLNSLQIEFVSCLHSSGIEIADDNPDCKVMDPLDFVHIANPYSFVYLEFTGKSIVKSFERHKEIVIFTFIQDMIVPGQIILRI